MKLVHNIDAVGICIKNWDEFYSENYSWALSCISTHIPDLSEAKKVLDKIFLNLTLDTSLNQSEDKIFKDKLSIKLAGAIAAVNRRNRRLFYESKPRLQKV